MIKESVSPHVVLFRGRLIRDQRTSLIPSLFNHIVNCVSVIEKRTQNRTHVTSFAILDVIKINRIICITCTGASAVSIGPLGCSRKSECGQELWPCSSWLLVKTAEPYERVARAVWLKSCLIRSAVPCNHTALTPSLTSHIKPPVSTLPTRSDAVKGVAYKTSSHLLAETLKPKPSCQLFRWRTFEMLFNLVNNIYKSWIF